LLKHGLNWLPYEHPALDQWRNNFQGIRFHHQALNLLLYGALDDVWIDMDTKELSVVDYKATATTPFDKIDKPWHDAYKMQISFYSWLLENLGFPMSGKGIILYANGQNNAPAFDGKLSFSEQLFVFQTDSSWILPTLENIRKMLQRHTHPASNPDCKWCKFVKESLQVAKQQKRIDF